VAPDLAAIPASITASGFRAGRFWIEARGRAAEVPGGGQGFRIESWPQVLPLAPGGAAADGMLAAEVLYEPAPLRLRPGPRPGS
jgi:hypothetical protein